MLHNTADLVNITCISIAYNMNTTINLPTSLGINSTFNSLSAFSCDNLTGNFFPEGPKIKMYFEFCVEY